MSSVVSSVASANMLITKFSALITPSYSDMDAVSNEEIDMAIPFILMNGVLNINTKQSQAIKKFVDSGMEPLEYANIQAKPFGGASLVTSLGPDMKTYLQNWIGQIENLEEPYTGPLDIYIKPIMTKIQIANPNFAINNAGPFQRDSFWGITTEAPLSSEYIGGGFLNNYYTAWVFKTPLTIKYVISQSQFKYITLTTQFAEQ